MTAMTACNVVQAYATCDEVGDIQRPSKQQYAGDEWCRRYCAQSMGTQQLFVFLSLVTLTFDLDFEFGWDFCTVYLTAKVGCPKFSCLEVIVQKNTLTNRRRWKHPPCSAMLRRWVSSSIMIPSHKWTVYPVTTVICNIHTWQLF